MTELHEMDATDQADLLHRRQVSAVELVQHHLDRIDRYGKALGAFVTVTAEQALVAARAADASILAGRAPAFAGVPTAIKDLTPTAGVPTSMGSAAMRGFVPDVDAHVVDLLRRAGFISLGKTNTPEFGLSSYTDNDLVGPARTPWDLARNAGGSSGGAAAAVSAGLVPLAQGSDGGGSIRIPASSCGIFGFKPSRGRVSVGPTGSDWSGLAVDGPLARTVRDAAALLDVMAHAMPGDLRPLPDPDVPFAERVRRDPGRLRIARWSGTHLEGIDPGADAVAAWEEASRLLESLGHEVVDIANPFPQALEPQFNVIWSSGIAGAPIPPAAEPLLRANTRYWRERGGRASAVDLARAMQFLEATTRDVITGLREFDAFLTPTLALPPQPVEWFNESGDPAQDHHRELLYTPYTGLNNMSGQPAASLPLHWSADGLPIGVMLATHPAQDGLLFSLCAQVEAAAPWHARRPPGF
ncbi:amidase [Aeromicrobium wangtongii]|uniref:Amidase n=1 Tax=Aeromicrobium wangtongii TaxID=2969247 RepID=A0ABY5M8T3_9ACTN|nr:amidase [Aeromicrobium wangtongii]MCD9199907.1 amidase [Aeromicrobium wangtongii]UUP13524.1 amidase [Aeromicrobium wangtongii]